MCKCSFYPTYHKVHQDNLQFTLQWTLPSVPLRLNTHAFLIPRFKYFKCNVTFYLHDAKITQCKRNSIVHFITGWGDEQECLQWCTILINTEFPQRPRLLRSSFVLSAGNLHASEHGEAFTYRLHWPEAFSKREVRSGTEYRATESWW